MTDDLHWWRHAVVYQVYIRSFADGNGDGTGDIAGLRSRLDHLVDLGVDAVWVNPWYPSPLRDGGYDVADYRNIHPDFGTLEEAEALIDEMHERGIRLIVDVVPNHTSSEHEWFRAALAAGPGSPERERYIFMAGKGADGSRPPTNWRSVFGGPAWTRVDDGEWYLHLFDPSQPDLNWEHPEVRAEFESILEFWLDRGVDGFRVDVAHGMVKHQEFPDVVEKSQLLGSTQRTDHPHWDRDGIHEIVRSWRRILDRYDDRMMVAEAWVHPDRLPLYLRPDEYHQSFDFDLLAADWTVGSLRSVVSGAVARASAIGAANTWVLSNHDVMRHATRYGLPAGTNWREWPVTGPHDVLDPALGRRRARAAALVLLGLPGSAYLYQGEELGLPEVWDLPAEVLDDPVWTRSGGEQKGRDGCRVPIPWSPDGPSFGFGDAAPWLPQPDGFGPLSVAEQVDDADSMLALYREAIALRREHLLDRSGFALIDVSTSVFAFARGRFECHVNLGSDPIALPEGRVLLASRPLDGGLPSDAAVWVLR